MNHSTLPDFDALWDYSNPARTHDVFQSIAEETEASASEAYRVELQTQIARTLSLQRKFDEAHATLDAIESSPAVHSGRPRLRYLLERGRTYNSSGHKASAVPVFVEAYDIGVEIGEDGLAVDAAHMVAIAETPEQSVVWNLKALDLATRSSMQSARDWRKSLHNNLGWTYYGCNEFDHALQHFIASRELAEESQDAEAERIARWCIAKTTRKQGRIEEALAMQQQQLAEMEAQGRAGPFIFEELAECLHALGRSEEAVPYFKLAYESLSRDIWIAADEPERLQRLATLAGIIAD